MGSDQKNALTAILLSGAILFGWQYFFGTPNAEFTSPDVTKTSTVEKVDEVKEEIKKVEDEASVKASYVDFVTSNSSFKISNTLSITEVVDVFDKVSLHESIPLTDYQILFNIKDTFKPVSFELFKVDNKIVFKNTSAGISGSIEPNEKGSAKFIITSKDSINYRFVIKSNAVNSEDGSFLPAVGDSRQLKFIYNGADFNSVEIDGDNRGDEKLKWFGVEGNFRIFTTVLSQSTIVKHDIEKKEFVITTAKPDNTIAFKLIFTKKDYDNLLSIGDNLHLTLDFGIWSVIAVPILRGLQFFYSFFHNYGVAIIFLTIFIRLLTFPLQYKSFKSMKKMQLIQPEMAKLKERYKNDPQRMQKETMALFKKSGANPLGGCLPMLLQMPIFFAFYRVLFSSVELVNAPFILWITDLSQKDPYYVLPILMAVAMVLNQKMMPTTTTDPTQKKMMMFMPLIFVVFMKDFPAGLVLYTVVSTIMGMLQQLFVYKRT